MAEQKKPKKKQIKYLCPYCGNDAPFKLKFDKDVKCFYCRGVYSKDERIKVSVGK
mgnify:CR=1 FL=1